MSGERVVEFNDGFETGHLDPERWVTAYLPQWSSRRRAAPTGTIDRGRLVLEITPEQEPWCPEWDGAAA